MQKKILLTISVLIILYAISGFYAVPYFTRPYMENKLIEILDRKAGIQKIEINPFNLKIKIKMVTLKNKTGNKPFVSSDELFLNIEPGQKGLMNETTQNQLLNLS